MLYEVTWEEIYEVSAVVEADSEEEAATIARRDGWPEIGAFVDIVEGTTEVVPY